MVIVFLTFFSAFKKPQRKLGKKKSVKLIENVKTQRLKSLKINTCKENETCPSNQYAQIPYPILKGFHAEHSPLPSQILTYD